MSLKSLVIGGAGFIGSHLVDRLVARGPVTVLDNLSVGRRAYIAPHLDAARATLIEDDALDLDALGRATAGQDVVFHLAANPEARWGLENTRLDLEQGTIVTHHVLEAARRAGVGKVVFASSGTVYGDTSRPCAEEDLGALPISLYGASKLAGEAMVSAFVECFGLMAWVFRFGNVVGSRGTHGAALDFLTRLRERPDELEVLGDGNQQKPYLHASDCVDGMLFGFDHASLRLNVLNLAPRDATTVRHIAELCVAASRNPSARIRYAGGDRGWPGDVPRSLLVPDKLAGLGFCVRLTSDQAVARAVQELALEIFGSSA